MDLRLLMSAINTVGDPYQTQYLEDNRVELPATTLKTLVEAAEYYHDLKQSEIE
ncbi:hypothetical protein LCGC14_1226980 [marine sediment metagenome]|uniref:Uncharacterized protein n=1 Tax=marine sediment metagenome TaxID=412755 RepID=A0A0F9LWS2_9ZZZZ